MGPLTKPGKIFDEQKFNINDMIVATDLEDGEILSCLVSDVCSTMIEVQFLEGYQTDYGWASQRHSLNFCAAEMHKWDLKKVEKTGEILTMREFTLNQDLFWIEAGNYVLLHHKPTKQKVYGFVTYGVEEKCEITYVVGELYQSETKKITITLEQANEWEIEVLATPPFLNNSFKEKDIGL